MDWIPVRSVLLALLSVMLLVRPAVADSWDAQLQQRIEETPSDSSDRLELLLMSGIALSNHDCRAARRLADQAVALAESLKDSNYQAASRMLRACIRGELEAAHLADKDYFVAGRLFDHDAPPKIATYYWLARALFSDRWTTSDEASAAWNQAAEFAEQSDDAELRAVVAALPSFRGSPLSGKLIEWDDADSQRDPASWPLRISKLMSQLRERDAEPSFSERIAQLETALSTISASGIRTAKLTTLNMLVAEYEDADQIEEAIAFAKLAVEEAEALGSKWHQAEQLGSLGRLKQEAGEDATSTYRRVAELALEMGMPTNDGSAVANAFDAVLASNESEELQQFLTAAGNRLSELHQQRREIYERATPDGQQLAGVERPNATSSKITSTLGIGIVIGFGLICMLTGMRLHRVNCELVEQIEEARCNREMREALEEKVTQIERMDSLGMLAGGVAHDFNNLLLGVLGNAEILKSLHQEELSRECIDGIIRSAQTASELSHKMLTYAGKRGSDKVACDLNDLIGELFPLLKSGLGSNDRIEFRPLPEPAVAEMDPSQIEQVLLNLVNNAKDSLGEHGEIRIFVGEEHIEDAAHDPTLFGQRTVGGDFVFFEVMDDGHGIEENVVKRMFEPFFSTKQGGRGLGLSVVYGYVNKHDGLIRCSSIKGRGTNIRILLPKCPQDQLEDWDGEDSDKLFLDDSDSSDFRLRGVPQFPVLVVDDDWQVLDVVRRLLEGQDYPCEMISGGAAAIEYLENDAQVACLVLDLVMPDCNGDEVLEWLRTAGIELPVVVMSGYSRKNLQDYLAHPCVVGVLEKPFSRKQLFVEIKRAYEDGSVSGLGVS